MIRIAGAGKCNPCFADVGFNVQRFGTGVRMGLPWIIWVLLFVPASIRRVVKDRNTLSRLPSSNLYYNPVDKTRRLTYFSMCKRL